MFEYPRQAAFNCTVPKSKIYQHARAGRALRQRFVDQVDEIVWKFKLSPETINLPARHGIREIQVFGIALRTGDLDKSVILAIEKAIPSHVFFELAFKSRVRFAGAYKRPSETDASKVVIEAAFETPWQPAAAPRLPLPVALDFAGLYDRMLRAHMPIPARPGEPLADHVERADLIRLKLKECRTLETRMQREVQFNRKVEINALLRECKAELAELQQSS